MTVIDFPAQLAATGREVLVHTDDGVEMRTVVLRQTYPTPVADLWEACTTADRLARWFQPVSGDLIPGGRYQVEGNAGGTIEQCEAPRFLRVTWEFGDGRSWVELHLAAAGESSRLELRHIAPMNDFWTQYGPGAVGVGWDLGFLGLALYLPTGEALDRGAVEAAMMSPAGLDFIRGSATAWGEAAIAAGEDADGARTAVVNTSAFYTGVPAES